MAGRTVLDPFMGGAVMLQESARLGADVVGVDVEPVAAAIGRFQLALRDLPDLEEALREIEASVGRDLAPFYKTEDELGGAEKLLHAFWVQVIRCGRCGTEFDAHPSFRLAWSDVDDRQWIVCRGCGDIVEAARDASGAACYCGEITLVDGGPVQRGVAQCPECEEKESLIDVARRTGERPRFRLFGVETLPNGDDKRVRGRQRRLRGVSDADLESYDRAERRLHTLLKETPSALPIGRVPQEGRADSRLVAYGYKDYAELFNARQKLHLAMLGAKLGEFNGAVQKGLAIAFSDHLTTNNMMCAYAGGWRRLAPLFAIRAYRHIARPVEINPWLRNNGRGTYPNAVRAVTKASAAIRSSREPSPRGLHKKVKDAAPATVDVVCGDAQRLQHVPSNSVDLVLTDPPYFDYVAYSELGHFFTPWLRHFGLIEETEGHEFPRSQIASRGRSFTAQNVYARNMLRALREIARVCKPEGRVVFTYQNLDGKGWSALASALANSGVTPIHALPLYGDSSASLHKHALSGAWDVVVVCRLGTPCPELALHQEDRASGRRVAGEWARQFGATPFGMNTRDLDNVSQAEAIVAAFARHEGSVAGV